MSPSQEDEQQRLVSQPEVAISIEPQRSEPLRASDKFERSSGGARSRPAASSTAEAKLSLSRLLREGLSEWRLMALGTFCLFASSAAMLGLPALFGATMDGVISNSDADSSARRAEFRRIGIQIAGLTLAGAVFGLVQGFAFGSAGASLVCSVRRRLFGAIMHQPVGFFDQTHTGELTSRLSSDVTLLRMALTSDISQALKSVVVLTGGVCYLLWMSWRLTLVMLGTMPVAAGMAVFFGSRIRELQKQIQKTVAESTAEAEEAISNIRTVRTFSAEAHHAALYQAALDASLSLMKRSALVSSAFGSGMGLLFGAGTLAVLAYGVCQVIDGEISAGTLTSFILYTFTITGAVGQLTGVGTSLMRVAGAAERIFGIIDSLPASCVDSGEPVASLQCEIDFKQVDFAYPSRPGQPVLQQFTLRLAAGAVTALVGPSGGGKSTVASLLTRLYAPTAGQITLDGADLQPMDLRQLHCKMATVSQEPVLFSGTIRENILYACEHGSEAKMIQAAEMANAHQFIQAFEHGYDTLVGERGICLSGGQKQRVAIARALVRDPSLLLLDEATSALDSESESLVQQALTRCVHGRTVLVIAHRLATVQDAHCVAYVAAGRVEATGTHNELLLASVAYSKLVEKQLIRT